MPSNAMVVCPTCRTGRKSRGAAICPKCGTSELYWGTRTTLPKKNNHRAWRRIAKGETLWDRRKSRHRNLQDTFTKYETRKVAIELEPVDCEHECCQMTSLYRVERVPGSGREMTNYRRTPDVDLGA